MPDDPLATLPVLILAGGLGTRLRPVLADRPKALAPVGNKPFLELQIELLRDQGARRIVLCVGHRADQIQEHFGDGRRIGVCIDYSVETGQLLGTAGALRLAAAWFNPQALVLNGDTYFPLDYGRMVEHHRTQLAQPGLVATIALARAPDASRYGRVLLDPAGENVVGFLEKETASASPSCWLNAGAYVIQRELIDQIPAGRPVSLEREVFPEVLRSGARIAAFTSQEPFLDIGTPEGLEVFAAHYSRRSQARPAADSRPAVFLDRDGVVIEEVGYLRWASQVRLLPGAAQAIARLNRLAVPVVVITNQAGVAHGYFPQSRIAEVHGRLDELLSEHGARIDRYESCPHHPDAAVAEYRAACACRKPAPGMLLRAARARGIDLGRSWLVGDKLSDLEAGLRAGCRVVLVRTGYGREVEARLDRLAPARVEVAEDLARAVESILDSAVQMGHAA